MTFRIGLAELEPGDMAETLIDRADEGCWQRGTCRQSFHRSCVDQLWNGRADVRDLTRTVRSAR